MRKKATLLLTLILALGLASCGGAQESSSSAGEQSSETSQTASSEERDPDVIAVEELIAALTDSSTEEEITAARTAYDALSDEEKADVTNLDALVAAEEKLSEDKAAAAAVDELITALGDDYTEEEVAAARTAYDALNDRAKTYVTGLTTLEAAETAIADAKAAAASVDETIAALGTDYTEDEVVAARTAYDALNERAKGYVANLVTLEAAEAVIAQAKADAAAVETTIAALTDSSTEDEVTAARTAYDALSDRAKAYVTNLSALEAQEQRIESEKKAAAVTELIAALPDVSSYKITDGADIDEAYTAYSALTESEQALVTNASSLTALKTDYDTYYSFLAQASLASYSAPNGALTPAEAMDADYGDVLSFNGVAVTDWFSYQIKSDASVSDYSEVCFYVYNSESSAITLWLMNSANTYAAISQVSLPAGQWTRVSVPVDTSYFPNSKVSDLVLGAYLEAATLGDLKVTSFYGVKAAGAARTYATVDSGLTLNGSGVTTGTEPACAAIASGNTYGESPAFRTAEYSNITSVSFDLRMDGSLGTDENWWSLKYGDATNDIYSGTAVIDGGGAFVASWTHYEATLDSVSGTLYFVHACNPAFTATVYIANVTIVANGVTYTEDFADDDTLFGAPDGTKWWRLDGESQLVLNANADILGASYAAIDSSAYSSDAGGLNFITASAYEKIRKVGFDCYYSSDPGTHWWGIGTSNDASTASIYTNILTSPTQSTSDLGGSWVHYSFAFDSTTDDAARYVYFVLEVGQITCTFYIDNFTITYNGDDSPLTVSEDFTDLSDSILVTDSATVNGVWEVVSEAADLTSVDVPAALASPTNYAAFASEAEITCPPDQTYIEGSFRYTLSGDKTFAVVLGKSDTSLVYALIDSDSFDICTGATVTSTLSVPSDLTISVSITKDLNVSVNGSDAIALTEYSGLQIVNLAGSGTATITGLNFSII